MSWLKHTAWTGAGSFHSEFLPARGLSKGMNLDLQLIETEEESSSNAIQPFTPKSPLMHHPVPWFLVVEASRMVALGLLQVHANLWYLILTIWFETKGSTKLSCAKCPGQEAQVTNATDTEHRCWCWDLLLVGAGIQGAGFCSFWELSAEIPAGIRLWNTTVWYCSAERGRKAPFQVWGAHTQCRGVGAAHKQTDLHSCTETTRDLRLLSGLWAGLCSPFLRPTGKMTAMRIFWSCRVLQLQMQHKFVKGPNHSQSVKKQDREKCRGKIECTAWLLFWDMSLPFN